MNRKTIKNIIRIRRGMYNIDIFRRLLDFILLRAVLIVITCSSLFCALYIYIKPIAYFSLSYCGVDVTDLFNLEENENISAQILELQQKIVVLKDENEELKTEVRQAMAEKEGVLSGLSNLTIEKINWTNLVKFSGGAIIFSGAVYFFFFHGSDVTIFRPIISHITENVKTLIELSGNNSKEIIGQLVSNRKKIEDLEGQIQILINLINSKK